jgi:hypothetical protein
VRSITVEKSDCAVIPVNQPNKEGQPSAEAGEGRAQPKENIDQSRMLPAQSGKRMSQGLDGVRKAAKERKQERFTSLLHHLNVDLLRNSYYALQRKASPGVDSVRWQEYETGLEDRLIDLHGRVHRGTYRAQPSRRVYIPKLDGRQRPIIQDGHFHRLRDTFSVRLLEKGVPLETVAVLLGNTMQVCQKHYAPWVKSRQTALEAAVKATWA